MFRPRLIYPRNSISLKNEYSFLIGQSAGAADQGTSKSPWVYITVDGVLQSCRLFVYNVGNHGNHAYVTYMLQSLHATPVATSI